MEQIKLCMTKLLSWIDSGKFFIHPMRWLYIVFAYLSFVPPIAVLYFIGDVADVLDYLGGWTKISGFLFFFFFVALVVIAALLMFQFWMNRSNKVVRVINEGDQIVAMPTVAHLLQSVGEANGVYACIVPPLGAILFYVWGILTGFKYVSYGDQFFEYFFLGLLVLVLFIAACLIVGYILVILAHFTGESIRVRAQIANDVRDLGDIHRAATMIREAEVAADAKTAEEPLSEE